MLINQFSDLLLKQGITDLMEVIDNPIVVNIKAGKDRPHEKSLVLAQHQAYLIESIEIKGIKKHDSLFNSKECLLTIIVGNKIYCKFTLQLFYYSKKKEAYIYELSIPVMIQSLQTYTIRIEGIGGNIIVILHGKNARRMQ